MFESLNTKTKAAVIASVTAVSLAIGTIELTGAIGGHTPWGVHYLIAVNKFSRIEKKYGSDIKSQNLPQNQLDIINQIPTDTYNNGLALSGIDPQTYLKAQFDTVKEFVANRGRGKLVAIPVYRRRSQALDHTYCKYVYYKPLTLIREEKNDFASEALQDWEAVNQFVNDWDKIVAPNITERNPDNIFIN